MVLIWIEKNITTITIFIMDNLLEEKFITTKKMIFIINKKIFFVNKLWRNIQYTLKLII